MLSSQKDSLKPEHSGADLRCRVIAKDCKVNLVFSERKIMASLTHKSTCLRVQLQPGEHPVNVRRKGLFSFFYHRLVFTQHTHTLKRSHPSQLGDCLDLAYFMD